MYNLCSSPHSYVYFSISGRSIMRSNNNLNILKVLKIFHFVQYHTLKSDGDPKVVQVNNVRTVSELKRVPPQNLSEMPFLKNFKVYEFELNMYKIC